MKSQTILCMGAIAVLACSIAFGTDDPNVAKGFVAGQVYQFGDIAHVNLFNGNLNIALPIGPSYPVSSHLSYSLRLSYSGNNWNPIMNSRNTCPNGPDTCGDRWYTSFTASKRFNAGLGWLISLGGLIPTGDTRDSANSPSGYRSPDSADHTFDMPGSVTGDGSFLRIIQPNDCPTGIPCKDIEFPDGTVRRFRTSDGQLIRIQDRFGKKVDVTYDSSSGAPVWTINDGIRTHTVTFIKLLPGGTQGSDDPSTFYVVKRVDLARFGGGTASYIFNYTSETDGVDKTTKLSRRGPNLDPYIANTLWLPILTSITLPDNTRYTVTTNVGDLVNADSSGVTGHITALK